MSLDDEKLEKVKEFLWGRPCHFCLVYRVKQTGSGVELKWWKAVSLTPMDHEAYDKLAAKYREIASDCFNRNRNVILQENLQNSDSPGQNWCGFKIHTGPLNQFPANALGQRWWRLIIGAGPTRSAGYVIVTRIGARESKELHEDLAKIQAIMKEGWDCLTVAEE